jgi:hypothetical protein
MSDIELENILEIARQLVGRLPVERDVELRRLITCAEEQHDPDIELDIVSLLTQDDNIRRWMNEQAQLRGDPNHIKPEYEAPAVERGFEPLAGARGSVRASRKWKCTKYGCTQSLPVIQEDEDAPRCRVHGCLMTRDGGKG